MTDRLDAAIRARLEERPCFATHELHGDRARDANGWISHAKAAIVAVLDLHHNNGDLGVCYQCEVPFPMDRTVRVIAEKLGVEVPHG